MQNLFREKKIGMGKNPNLKPLEKHFEKGETFELTDAQYEKITRAPLPKSKYYILQNSAQIRKAEEYDFSLEVIEKKVILKK